VGVWHFVVPKITKPNSTAHPQLKIFYCYSSKRLNEKQLPFKQPDKKDYEAKVSGDLKRKCVNPTADFCNVG
jgi:hypothetical protein